MIQNLTLLVVDNYGEQLEHQTGTHTLLQHPHQVHQQPTQTFHHTMLLLLL